MLFIRETARSRRDESVRASDETSENLFLMNVIGESIP